MKKRIFTAALVVLMLLFSGLPGITAAVKASPDQTFVFDYADVLSSSEEAELEALAHKIGSQHGTDIIIMFFDTGYSLEDLLAAADDFFDNGLYGYEEAHGTGVVLAVDVKSRAYQISTSGYAEDYFSDSRLYDMEDEVVPHLSDNDWAGAARAFIRYMKKFQNPTVQKSLGLRLENALERLPLYGVIGAAASGIYVFFRSKKPSSGKRVSGGNYLMPGSYSLVQADDRFVNEFVTKTRIATNTGGRTGGGGFSGGGGGGGGHHVSSGGFSHGGHGGHF